MLEDNKNNKQLSDGLLRQRRNLILISLVMPLFFISGASVNKINMFGTVIELTSQSGINIVLFVSYFYFLWRYLQYYLVEERAKEFRILRNSNIYQKEFKFFKELLRPKADCFDLDGYYPQFRPENRVVGSIEKNLPSIKHDNKLGLFKRSRIMEIAGLPRKYESHYLKTGDEHVELSDSEVKNIAKNWLLVNKYDGDTRHGAIFETDVEYNFLFLSWLRLKQILKFNIVHPYYSDYVLPFIIAGISLSLTIFYL